MKRIYLFLVTTLLLLSGMIRANNILVTNASISGQNTTNHTALINFDVSWDNSWRTSTNENNYDGAWIFIKYRKNGTLDWRHATINITGYTAATGSTITVSADGKGGFIYRNANGIGNVSYTGNKLLWNYSVDGLLDNETVEIRVFALEMVYIPQGGFQLGSGGTELNAYKTGATAAPYNVGSAAITFGTTGSNLNTNGNGPTSGTLPVAFPTGYNPFWIMKYETSQQQYADFLNHLDAARAIVNNTAGIFTGSHPNLIAPAPERAMLSVNSQRLAALADWSGLRPYTEMEYEKVCRGYNTPAVPNEYAWGTTSIFPVSTLTNIGAVDETVASPAGANANIASSYNNLVRVGLFARATGSTRELSGATYYGVMNMSDNTSEIIINASDAAGLAFDGSIHGDGNLAANGNSDQTNWTSFSAYGWRGSSFIGTLANARISDRQNASAFLTIYGSDIVLAQNGIRLARTAP